jgi:prephenate dehydrogenase (EC 1.3.1.12)
MLLSSLILPGPITNRIVDTVIEAGNHVFRTTPNEHDMAMQTVQASAHAAVLAYALAAADVRDEFATPVSRALDDIVATVTDGIPPCISRDTNNVSGR